MIYILTSSPRLDGVPILNPANGFVEAVREALPNPCDALFVASDPDIPDITDEYAGLTRAAFEGAGVEFSSFNVLDGRSAPMAPELVSRARFVFLAGGHVPTQRRFFELIDLRRLLCDFDGLLMGNSAGSMNAAEVVYAQPELPGEAIDASYQRFIPGLGITPTMVIPHLNEMRDATLDGMRVYEDIALPDSLGRRFYALPDGSYVWGTREPIGTPCGSDVTAPASENARQAARHEEVRGACYLVHDGVMELFCSDGEVRETL